MSMVNKISLLGHVGGMPEIKQLTNNKLATFSIATPNQSAKEGHEKPKPDWHTIKAWDKQADRIEKMVGKGDHLAIEGELKYEKFTSKDGVKMKVAVIRLHDFRKI